MLIFFGEAICQTTRQSCVHETLRHLAACFAPCARELVQFKDGGGGGRAVPGGEPGVPTNFPAASFVAQRRKTRAKIAFLNVYTKYFSLAARSSCVSE